MADAKKATKKTKAEEKAELEAIIHASETIVEVEAKEIVEANVVSEESKSTAKAGKRSAKAIAETEEKLAKEERKAKKATGEIVVEKPKQPIKPTRPKIERRGKKFQDAAKHVDKTKQYTTSEAVALAIKTSPVKFDATVEVHIRLGVDPRQADQNLRDNLVLPSGTGKKVRIAVFAEDDVVKDALKAGADVAGYEDFLQRLDKGEINFDILIATPNVMAKLSKHARTLGPKGLMPNPKSGTVTNDVAKAISAAKAGRVEYRVDSTGIVHLGIGKVSFGDDKLKANLDAVFASIRQNKPNSLKGTYVKSITLSTTMGPGIKIAPSEL